MSWIFITTINILKNILKNVQNYINDFIGKELNKDYKIKCVNL